MREIVLPLMMLVCGCGSEPELRAGTATIVGTVGDLNLASSSGVSIARLFPPTTEIKVSPSGLECDATQASERITIDLGDNKVGQYTVVSGFPEKRFLSAAQARAHACPAKTVAGQEPCHDQVLAGKVTVTRFDPSPGGRIEGTYEIELADGKVSGSFSAYRCN